MSGTAGDELGGTGTELTLEALAVASAAIDAAVDALPTPVLSDVDALVQLLCLSVSNRLAGQGHGGGKGEASGSDSDGSDDGSDDDDGESGHGGAGTGAGAGAGAGAARAGRDRMGTLQRIRLWLREQVSVEAVMPSEQLVYSGTGDFASYTAGNSVSVDGFLFDDDDVDRLADEGKLARNYCTACGSRDVKPLNFVSHSLSVRELAFVFRTLLPLATRRPLSELCLVDVGSRLGAVLFAGVLIGGVGRCVGVEINEEFCTVQREACRRFGLLGDGGKRDGGVEVVCDDVMRQGPLLATADVVVLHNAFQFFSSPRRSAEIWSFIASSLKPGCVIVSSPSLAEQLACCTPAPGDDDSGPPYSVPDLSAWVEEVPTDDSYPIAEDSEDEYADDDGRLFTDLKAYTVRAKLPLPAPHTADAAARDTGLAEGAAGPAPATVVGQW